MATAVAPNAIHESQVTARARVVSAIQRQGALIALLALIIFATIRYGPSFYSVYNIFDAFLNNNTYYALIALGMTFVIITGGIDLSVGSVAVLAAVAAARAAGLTTWALTGAAPNPLAARVDDAVCVPATATATVQEVHQVVVHLVCAAVDVAVGAAPAHLLEEAW